jgi:hypothetical protein
LNAAGTAESSTGGDVEEVYVRAVESVPESHVAFISAGGIEDWDLVRFGHSYHFFRRIFYTDYPQIIEAVRE